MTPRRYGQTPTGQFTAALVNGYQPSDAELVALMTALHDAVLDTPLMQWLDRSFEDMADTVHRASVCVELESEQLESTT